MKNIKEWLGEENKLGFDIWNKKYRYREESLEEWFERVSGGDEALKQAYRRKKNFYSEVEFLPIEELKKAAISTIVSLMVMFPTLCLVLWTLRRH